MPLPKAWTSFAASILYCFWSLSTDNPDQTNDLNQKLWFSTSEAKSVIHSFWVCFFSWLAWTINFFFFKVSYHTFLELLNMKYYCRRCAAYFYFFFISSAMTAKSIVGLQSSCAKLWTLKWTTNISFSHVLSSDRLGSEARLSPIVCIWCRRQLLAVVWRLFT